MDIENMEYKVIWFTFRMLSRCFFGASDKISLYWGNKKYGTEMTWENYVMMTSLGEMLHLKCRNVNGHFFILYINLFWFWTMLTSTSQSFILIQGKKKNMCGTLGSLEISNESSHHWYMSTPEESYIYSHETTLLCLRCNALFLL